MPVDRVRRAKAINAASELGMPADYRANRNSPWVPIINLRANSKNTPVCFNEMTDREDTLNNVMRTGPQSHVRRTNRWCFASQLCFQQTDGTRITLDNLIIKLTNAKLL